MPKIHFEKLSRDDFHSVKIHVYKPEGRLSSIWSWLTMKDKHSESFHKTLNKNSFKLKINPECLQELKAKGELQLKNGNKNIKKKTLQSSVLYKGKENVAEKDFKFPLNKIKLVNCAELVPPKYDISIKHTNSNNKNNNIPKSEKIKTARNLRCKVGMKTNTNLSQTRLSQVFHKNTNVLLKSIPSTILHSNFQKRAERKHDKLNGSRDILFQKHSGQDYKKEEPNPIPNLLTKIESMEKHLSDVETKTNKLNELILKQNALRMSSAALYDLNTKDTSTGRNVTKNCASHKLYSKKAHSSQNLKKSHHKKKKEKQNVSLFSNNCSKTDSFENKGYPFDKFKDSLNTVLMDDAKKIDHNKKKEKQNVSLSTTHCSKTDSLKIKGHLIKKFNDSLNTVLMDDNKKEEKQYLSLSSNHCSKTDSFKSKGHPIEKFKDSLNTVLIDAKRKTSNNLVNGMELNFERYHRIIAVPKIIAGDSLDAQIVSVNYDALFNCFSTLSELEINSSSTFSQPEIEAHVSQHTLVKNILQSKPTYDCKYTSLLPSSDFEGKHITGDSEDTIAVLENRLIPAAKQSFKLKELVIDKSADETPSSNRFPCICLIDSENLSYVDSENSSIKLDHQNSVSHMNILENSELIVHKESVELKTQLDEHKTSQVPDRPCCKLSLKKIVPPSSMKTQEPKLKITILVEDGSKGAVKVDSNLRTQWKGSQATDNICNRPLGYLHTEEDNQYKTTRNDNLISHSSYFALSTSNTHNLLKTAKNTTFLKSQKNSFCRVCSDTSNINLNIHSSTEWLKDSDVKFGVEGKYIYQNQRNVCDTVNFKKCNTLAQIDLSTKSEKSMKNKIVPSGSAVLSNSSNIQKLSCKGMRPDYMTNRFGHFKPLLKDSGVSSEKYEPSIEPTLDKQHCKCICSRQHTSSNKTNNGLQNVCLKTSEISSITVQTDWTLIGDSDSVNQKHSVSCQTDIQMKQIFEEEISDSPEFDKCHIKSSQFRELASCQPIKSDKESTDKENKSNSNRFIPKKLRSLAIEKKKESVIDDRPSNLLFSLVRNNEAEIISTHDVRPENIIPEFCNKEVENVKQENTILPTKDQNNHMGSRKQQSTVEATHHCSSTCFPSWSDESVLSRNSDSASSVTQNCKDISQSFVTDFSTVLQQETV